MAKMTTGPIANLKSKRGQKQKSAEPSLRDKLSENVLRAIEADFAENGVAAVELLRQKSPEKYCEIATRLIAATEPKSDNGFEQCNSMQELGARLLARVGLNPDAATPEMIEAAIAAQDDFIARLEAIRDAAQGALQ
jgi:hypothetical protein